MARPPDREHGIRRLAVFVLVSIGVIGASLAGAMEARTLLYPARKAPPRDQEWYLRQAPLCINLTRSHVQWGPNLREGTAYYSLTYSNACDRPVVCNVTVQSGNRTRNVALAGTISEWSLIQARSCLFVLMPGASYTVRGGLHWQRIENGIPQIRFPDPTRGGYVHLIRCDFLKKAAD